MTLGHFGRKSEIRSSKEIDKKSLKIQGRGDTYD